MAEPVLIQVLSLSDRNGTLHGAGAFVTLITNWPSYLFLDTDTLYEHLDSFEALRYWRARGVESKHRPSTRPRAVN